MDNCELTISTDLRLSFPNVVWRQDLNLPAPVLLLPTDSRNFCLAVVGNNSRICLQWFQVAGASHYLLQWALDEQFSGPSLREAIVPAPTPGMPPFPTVDFPYTPVVYCLQFQQDIRQGDTVFWRVQAANINTGGLSLKSAVRKFTYSCPEGQSQEVASFCDEYDVSAVIKGRPYMNCCEYGTFWIELSYACTDVFGNPLIQLIDVDWKTNDAQVAKVVPPQDGILIKTGVQTCASETQVFEVTATLTFQDKFLNTFQCEAEPFTVLADCGDPNNKDFEVRLKDKFRSNKKGILQNCGEEVFVLDNCSVCFPCCSNFSYQFIDNSKSEFSVTPRNVLFNPTTCILEYELVIDIDPAQEDRIFEVLKGAGKSVKTPPNNPDTEISWQYEIPINVQAQIILSYRGCWRYQDTPYFLINKLQNNVTTNYQAGYWIRCLNPPDCTNLPIPKNTEFAIIGGPVFAVDDFECSADDWPTCINNDCASCIYGRVSVEYERVKYSYNKRQTYRYNVGCSCRECKEGYVDVTLMSSEIFPNCTDIRHVFKFDLYCDRRLVFSSEQKIVLSCAIQDTQYLDIEYCGCLFSLEIKNELGIYDPDIAQCRCIPKELTVCIEAENKAHCVSGIEWLNGQWILPNNNYLQSDTRNYVLEKLYFDGCLLKATVCSISSDCLPCKKVFDNLAISADCFCNQKCIQLPKEFNENVIQFTSGSTALDPVTVRFFLDCDREGYISESVIVPSASIGCELVGFFLFKNNQLFFEGRDAQGTPVLFTSNSLAAIDCTAGLAGDITLTQQCYLDGAPAASLLVNVTIFTLPTFTSCGECFHEELTFNIQQCEPLVASVTSADDAVKLSIGDTTLLDQCGCKIPGALEARVNIPLGCGLTISEDLDYPDQKTIAVDLENLVGVGKETQSLAVSYQEGCGHITLPICDCVGFVLRPDAAVNLPPNKILTLVKKAFLFKGYSYKGKVSTNILRGDEGNVEILDYSNVNPNYRAVTIATNHTDQILVAGQEVVVTVTDGCEIFITSLVVDPNSVPPPVVGGVPRGVTTFDNGTDSPEELDPNFVEFDALPAFAPPCNGFCRWIWNGTQKKWYLSPESFCSDVTPPTTTPPTTVPPSTGGPGTTTPSPTTPAPATGPPIICFNQSLTGYCVLTCVDLNGTGEGKWQYIGRYDGANPGYQCNPFEEGIACPELGATKCVDAIPIPPVPTTFPPRTTPGPGTTTPAPTTSPPVEGCVYTCDSGFWRPDSYLCPPGFFCDSSFEYSPCDGSVPTTIRPCEPDRDCRCEMPTFCGVNDGDCTITACAPENTLQPIGRFFDGELDCGGPDSPTTSPPDGLVKCCFFDGSPGQRITREECCERNGLIFSEFVECPPVPTLECCSDSCFWFYVPQFNGNILIDDPNACPPLTGDTSLVRIRETEGQGFNSCGIKLGDRCGTRLLTATISSGNCVYRGYTFCSCSYPPNNGTPCSTVQTTCSLGSEVQRTCCVGRCKWLWICFSWTRLVVGPLYGGDFVCRGSSGGLFTPDGCECPVPSYSGSTGECAVTACSFRRGGGANTPGVELPCDEGLCTGSCRWQASGGDPPTGWELTDYTCSDVCSCSEPDNSPLNPCEVAITYCNDSTPPTTITPPTTRPPTTAPPLVNCCFNNTDCVEGVTEDSCIENGGRVVASCEDCRPPTLVDCCYPSGSCVSGLSESGCISSGGTPVNGCANCTTTPSPGSCCNTASGTCTDGVAEADCPSGNCPPSIWSALPCDQRSCVIIDPSVSCCNIFTGVCNVRFGCACPTGEEQVPNCLAPCFITPDDPRTPAPLPPA